MPFIRLLAVVLFFLTTLQAAKIKDLANVIGVRDNQLMGYGLVVGLNGTGDGSTSLFTTQSLSNLLASVNVKIDANAIKSKNIAAVIVTAKLPPFARQGDKLDISISSIGDAKSLEGGTLLMTPLKGVDGNIYALAQGAIAMGGFNGGGGGGRGQKNHTTAASIFGGAIVEREAAYDFASLNSVTLSLKSANFQNAVAIAQAINQMAKSKVAQALDPRTVRVEKPAQTNIVEFLSAIQQLEVTPERDASKIVIDEKTGTIVAGADIKIDPVVVTHGDVTIKIAPSESQINKGDVDMSEGVIVGTETNLVKATSESMTVATMARVLQKLGSKPKDIISIFEAMKKAGAIHADMEVL
ncbi:MAG: flagellar basal body P-ring protein FlgI [Campylobacterales bacterium]